MESGDHFKNGAYFEKPNEYDNYELLNEMKTMVGVFHWLPRIICIIAILFVSMFAADECNERMSSFVDLFIQVPEFDECFGVEFQILSDDFP